VALEEYLDFSLSGYNNEANDGPAYLQMYSNVKIVWNIVDNVLGGCANLDICDSLRLKLIFCFFS